MKHLKQLLRSWTPPIVLDAYRRCFGGGISFTGHYVSWREAAAASTGYDGDGILARVAAATTKVVAGEATYERDSVLFDVVDYAFPLLAVLLKTAADRQGSLNVLDFGGSLGSSYRQCKHFLPTGLKLNWCVVEQEKFVQHGREHFTNEELQFFFSIDECVKAHKPDIVLFASVLQYLENADQLLDAAMGAGANYIIIDRTPFTTLESDWLCVQKVPESIYDATYPCAMLSQSRIARRLGKRYVQVAVFDALGGQGAIHHGLRQIPFEYKGMIWRKR
jgi:putative methyltransferase (TIGR04325 family)